MRPGIVSGLFLCRFLGWAWIVGLMRSAELDAVCDGNGRSGRQNSVGNLIFCLLRSPRGADLDAVVDKIRQNSPFFVYFVVRSGWI